MWYMNQVSEISSLVNIQPLDDVSNVEFSNKIEYQQHNTLEQGAPGDIAS